MIFNIIVTIVALLISGFALFLSGLAFHTTGNTRRRDRRIEATIISIEARELLSGIEDQGRKVSASWDAYFAATGTYKSSMREGRCAEINMRVSTAKSLQGQLAKASADMKKLDDAGLEERIIKLRSIQVKAQAVSDWMDEKEEEHRRAAERHKNKQQRRFDKK